MNDVARKRLMTLCVAAAVSCYGVEKPSAYSFLGLDACPDYPGASYWSPFGDDQRSDVYNRRLLPPILKSLELAARFRRTEEFDRDMERLVRLLEFIALDRNNLRNNRLEASLDICYALIRIVDGGYYPKMAHFRRIASSGLFAESEKSWWIGRRLTFFKMVALGSVVSSCMACHRGACPARLMDCSEITLADICDAWGREISYQTRGGVWQLHSGGHKGEPQYYDFDAYVPAIEFGYSTISTFGVVLSSTFQKKRKELFERRCLAYSVRGKEFMCFLDPENILTSTPNAKARPFPPDNGAKYLWTPKLCPGIARGVFADRFDAKGNVECEVSDNGCSYVVVGRSKGVDGVMVLEMAKSDGRVLRCLRVANGMAVDSGGAK